MCPKNIKKSLEWGKIQALIINWSHNEGYSIDFKILQKKEPVLIKTCCISTKQARIVYYGRANNPNAIPGKTQGYKSLLKNLDSLELNNVACHSIRSDEIRLLVFTNCQATQIIGILNFDKELWKS